MCLKQTLDPVYCVADVAGGVAMEACLLVDVGSAVPQLLPAQTCAREVLEKGPFHTISLPSGWTLHWSSSSYQQSEVNAVATHLAQQLIKGDACLVHPNCQQHMLDELLQSRPWRMAQPCQPSTPRSSSSSSQMQQQLEWADSFSPSSSSNSSSHAALKRARSLQRIAAANSTRQRILTGMAAAAGERQDNSPVLKCITPPQRHSSWYGNRVSGRGLSSKQQHGTAQASKAALAGLPPVHTSSCIAAGGQLSAGRASARSSEQLPAQQQWHPHQHAYPEVIPFHLHNSSSSSSSSSRTPAFNSSSSLHEPFAAAAVTGVSLASHAGSSCKQLCSPSSASCSNSSSSSLLCGAAAVDFILSGSAAACSSVQCSTQQEQQDVDADVEMTEAEQQQQRQEGAGAAAAAVPAWSDLPEGLLGRVACCLGSSVAAVMPMYAACRAWRRAVLDDDQLLLRLRFSLNVSRPLKPAPSQPYYWHASARQQHPALLLRACKLGNVSALVARARLLDAAGCAEEGMRCWKRAAKAGHVEGQLLYGLGLYRGIAGLQEDAHDAHMWLLRALKQVQQPEAATSTNVASSSATAACSATPAAGVQAVPTAVAITAAPTINSVSADTSTTTTTGSCSSSSSSDSSSSRSASASELSALRQHVLAQAGLVLGYLAFDGEGSLKVDKQEATRYFRLAARAGSKEAEEVLGWVYNTGQYGAL